MKVLSQTLVVLVSTLAFAGEGATQGYLSCQSAASQDTIYFSSTWDGETNNDQRAFIQFLNTKYGYKGDASCSVAYKAYTTIPKLQQSHNATVAQWRSQGKKIVETGWTNNGAAALTGPAPNGPVTNAAAPKPKAPVPDPDDQPMDAKKSGPVNHYYCWTQRSGANPLYFTNAFDASSSDLSAFTRAFQTYVVQKYQYSGPIAASCANFPSVAAADQQKQASIAAMKKTPVKVIDTGWTYKAQ